MPLRPIGVRVGEGRVRLVGKVPDYVLRLRAGELASYVRGVQQIVNDVEVAWTPKLEDAALAKRIQRHLAANAETGKVADRGQPGRIAAVTASRCVGKLALPFSTWRAAEGGTTRRRGPTPIPA